MARVLQISRQAQYRTPTPRRPPQRRPVSDSVEQAIVAVAEANQSDGYRMVAADPAEARPDYVPALTRSYTTLRDVTGVLD